MLLIISLVLMALIALQGLDQIGEKGKPEIVRLEIPIGDCCALGMTFY